MALPGTLGLVATDEWHLHQSEGNLVIFILRQLKEPNSLLVKVWLSALLPRSIPRILDQGPPDA